MGRAQNQPQSVSKDAFTRTFGAARGISSRSRLRDMLLRTPVDFPAFLALFEREFTMGDRQECIALFADPGLRGEFTAGRLRATLQLAGRLTALETDVDVSELWPALEATVEDWRVRADPSEHAPVYGQALAFADEMPVLAEDIIENGMTDMVYEIWALSVHDVSGPYQQQLLAVMNQVPSGLLPPLFGADAQHPALQHARQVVAQRVRDRDLTSYRLARACLLSEEDRGVELDPQLRDAIESTPAPADFKEIASSLQLLANEKSALRDVAAREFSALLREVRHCGELDNWDGLKVIQRSPGFTVWLGRVAKELSANQQLCRENEHWQELRRETVQTSAVQSSLLLRADCFEDANFDANPGPVGGSSFNLAQQQRVCRRMEEHARYFLNSQDKQFVTSLADAARDEICQALGLLSSRDPSSIGRLLSPQARRSAPETYRRLLAGDRVLHTMTPDDWETVYRRVFTQHDFREVLNGNWPQRDLSGQLQHFLPADAT